MKEEILFDSIYSYYMLLARKTIFCLIYQGKDGLKHLSYVTSNEKYIDSTKDKIEDDLYDTETYVLYDISKNEWIKIYFNSEYPILEGQFHCLDEFNFESPEEILDSNNDIVEKYNQKIIELVKEKAENNKIKKISLIEDISKYNKDYSKDLFDTYFTLFKSSTIEYDECLFSCIFNISIEEYKNDKINDLNKFKEIFKEIIKSRQTKSLNEIDEESKNFSDNEEEMSEIQTIKDLINTSVEDSFKIIDESDEPSIIFDQYPTILQPSPDFLEDDGGETIYSICRDNVNNL